MRKVLFTGWGTRRHARRAEQPAATASTTGSAACVGYSGFDGTVGGETHRLPPGVLPLQARRLEARVPPQHEQQLLGRRLQRGGLALRLDGQRQPERLPADPEPLLRGGPRLVAERAAEHRRQRTGSTRSPTRSGRSISTAASPPRPATRSTRPAPIRRNTGTAPPSSPSRPATWSRTFVLEPRRQRLPSTQRAGTCWPATTSGPRRSWPRSGPTAMSG